MPKKPTKKTKISTAVPPFPPLHWAEFYWQGKIRLDAWAGFQSKGGPYVARSSGQPSDGEVRVIVMSANEAEKLAKGQYPDPIPPIAEQVQAFEDLLSSQVAIRDAVLLAMFKKYRPLLQIDAEKNRDVLSLLQKPDDLMQFMELPSVYVLAKRFRGSCSIGFQFRSEWDPEHGLGVLTNRGKVLDIGLGETAFTDFSERDTLRARIDRIGKTISSIVQRLKEAGYQFDRPAEVLPGPEANVAASIARIEQVVGEVPLALKLFWQRVGSVDFSGSHSNWKGCKLPNPLMIYPASVAIAELEDFLADRRERLRSNFPYAIPICPDAKHKADVSGGMWWSVSVPAEDDDPLIHNCDLTLTFVDYLEWVLHFGGFPGLIQSPNHTWPMKQLLRGLPSWFPNVERDSYSVWVS